MKRYLTIWCLIIPFYLQGQEQPGMEAEQQLENMTESVADADIKDDGWWQYLDDLKKSPLNVNTATATELMELQILSPLEVHQLLQYRQLLGNLISIYELQSVPGWELSQIEKLLPYVTVVTPELTKVLLKKRLTQGKHSILLRYSRALEKAKGYLNKDSTHNSYTGDPSRLLFRCKYQYKNLLQYGFTFSKDAGEAWFNRSVAGFDFYSFHLFAKGRGFIKSIALGDYTVNMGQGLIQWQGRSFGIGGSILQTKRQSDVLRPYNASGSFYFHRGAAVQIGKRHWQGTFFLTTRKLDANITENPAIDAPAASSILTSGYHRTQNEITNRGTLGLIGYGASLQYKNGSGNAGVNTVQYHFGTPVEKKDLPYNLFTMAGKYQGNYSGDYSFSLLNFHFFGETAIDHHKKIAAIHGILASLHAKADLSLLYRTIAKDYQSFYGSAFTAGTSVSNERGLFAGLSVRPAAAWKIDCYTDIFRFPWLKFRVDAPSTGKEYGVQVNYRRSKTTELYSRYRSRQKLINSNAVNNPMHEIVPYFHRSWRTQINHQISKSLSIRHRFELLWYKKEPDEKEKGFLAFFDIHYKPLQKPFSMNARLQFFESDSYNSRLYAFENDVLYYYAIPVFYGEGIRYYVNMRYKLTQYLGIWIKWGQSLYNDRDTIGSGPDEIKGNKKSEIRLLLSATF